MNSSQGKPAAIRQRLLAGTVIPAHPLALDAHRKLDERRQRGLTRYYAASGSGGVAVGVHTTQFAIRDPRIGLFAPVLALAREEMDRADAAGRAPLLRIGGICGRTIQAVGEARLLADLGYHAGLLSLAALKDDSEDALILHCRAVAEVIPLVGFYLQPSVGGRPLSYAFWRRFTEIEDVLALKIAPFNRYQTLDVVRAVIDSGRDDIALYTGNDDNIVMDLVTPYRMAHQGVPVTRRITGGLLGHWAVWTRGAVSLLEECRGAVIEAHVSPTLFSRAIEVTDTNAAFFDAANGFKGCIAGLHEVLRRQGIFEGIWCLDPDEGLSPGQEEEISRVYAAYPHLNDDSFVEEHREAWLSG